VLTLALGIGATAAVFTIVNGVLLRPLPYKDPSHLAMVWLTGPDVGGQSSELPLSAAFYNDVKTQSHSFSAFAVFRSWPYTLGDIAQPQQIDGSRVTPSLFRILGVHPLLGRTFSEDEAVIGGPNVVIISYDLWQHQFGGSPSIIGRRITLSGERATVIGVMPRGFAFPRGAELPAGLRFGLHTDVWTPLVFTPKDLQERGLLNLAGIGRLAPGMSIQQAQSDLDGILRHMLPALGADWRQYGYRVVGLDAQAAAPVERGLLIFLGAVAFVLLIACANVVNLLIARTGARQREFAVREHRAAAHHRERRARVRRRRGGDRARGVGREGDARARPRQSAARR
jgi:hypothetical protein